MAEAVLELYPETQVTIGPSIENGFYYDFHRETPFSEDDLAAIEARMHDIVDRDEEIIRNVWTRDEAVAFYKKNDEPFKIELVEAIPRARPSPFTSRAISSICAVVRTFPRPAAWAMPSS